MAAPYMQDKIREFYNKSECNSGSYPFFCGYEGPLAKCTYSYGGGLQHNRELEIFSDKIKTFSAKILYFDGSRNQEGKEIVEIEDKQIKVQLDNSEEPVLLSSLTPPQTEVIFNTLGKRKIIEHIAPGGDGRFEKIVGITIGTLMDNNESDQLREHSEFSESTRSISPKGSTPTVNSNLTSAGRDQRWPCTLL